MALHYLIKEKERGHVLHNTKRDNNRCLVEDQKSQTLYTRTKLASQCNIKKLTKR